MALAWLRIAVLFSLLLVAVKAYPSEHKFPCGEAKKVMKQNMLDGFAYFATAEEIHGIVIQLYIDLHNGDWRIMGIDSKLQGCNMLEGMEFRFLKITGM